MVGESGTLLEVSKATDDVKWHRCGLTDLEVVARAFGLRSPELVCRHLDFTQGVFFDSVVHTMIVSLMMRGCLQRGYRLRQKYK